ncbi:MAG: DJ-1/PfpI family protein [candidate division WOR-3 bacterium]
MNIAKIGLIVILTICSCQRGNSGAQGVLCGKALDGALKKFKFQVLPESLAPSLVMVIAPRAFRDEEFQTTYEFLTGLGYKLKVASRDTVLATGMLGLAVRPQLTIEEIDSLAYAGLILIGGTGAAIYWDDLTLRALIQYFARHKPKFVAAICLAPVSLARAGVLENRAATVYENSFTLQEFTKAKVRYHKTDCVLSENIITANGPEAANKFAQTIAYYLQTVK